MVRALQIGACLVALAATLLATPRARAVDPPNIIAASTTVGYVIPSVAPNNTFSIYLRVECLPATPCVGYQYELAYNPAIISFVSESTTNPGGFTLCPNATILPPPQAGMYGGCLRPDSSAQTVNTEAATLTFMCTGYGSAGLSLPAYDATAAPFGARTLAAGGGAIATTLLSVNVVCGGCPVTTLNSDTDYDGLGDACEANFGTNPNSANTDGGVQPDGAELLRGRNAVNNSSDDDATDDADGDGCKDTKEIFSGDWRPGGQRDPTNPWDFFDVPQPALTLAAPGGTRNKIIALSDQLAVLAYVGTSAANPNNVNGNGARYGSDLNGNGIPDGREYDRTASSDPARVWRSGPPNGVVSLADVLAVLAQVGTDCSQP